MQTKHDISYGVIPYIYKEGELHFLLIHQYSSARELVYWGFPKGHPDAGEDPETAARRELQEETGISLSSLATDHPFEITYEFMLAGVRVKKSVTFYLGEARDMNFVLQEEEVESAGWCTYEEARRRITFDNTKTVLDEAYAYLTKDR